MKEKILFCLAFFVSIIGAQDIEARLDSLGDYYGSTVISKDNMPVAVSGDFTVRMKHFDYTESSPLQDGARMRTFVNAALDAFIAVSPSSNMTLFSRLLLPFDFSGFFVNQQAFQPNSENIGNPGERVPAFHPQGDFYGASINESMIVGMDLRGGVFGATLLMGGVIWTSQSPLSMWERETNPRFISQYELYEEEKVVSTYYKEKGFKPVKEGGRAFWTNRSFGGWMLDFHTLPWDLKAQFLLSQPSNVYIGMRDGLRLNSRDGGEMELVGTYDHRGNAIGGRLAKEKITFGDASLTVGANYMGLFFDAPQVFENYFLSNFYNEETKSIRFDNPQVVTLDLKGNLTPKLFLALDFALSWDDSTIVNAYPGSEKVSSYYNPKETSSETSTPSFGVYAKVQDKHLVPMTLEFIYLPKEFYSPYSMTNPDRVPAWRKDQFYLGAGTYRYGPNMIGANLKIEPEFNRGRFDFQYGIHKQLEKGDDVINFKYNLVGRQLWETSSSWTRHKPFFNQDSGAIGRYVYRVGGKPSTYILNDRRGGLRSGYAETWDSFTPYETAQDAFYCSQSGFFNNGEGADGIPCNMPQSVKWNSTVAIDMGYDIGHWFNSDRNIMLQLFTSLSGVSSSFIPVAYTDKYSSDMLMWGLFVQSEPAIAITPTFHAILILGFENFRAEQAYVGLKDLTISTVTGGYTALYPEASFYYQLSPINIWQTALGFGFDWDFAARAGLHFRYKYLTNDDENLPQNNWKVHHVQAETKVWF